jgi:hypothetical protein
MAVELDDTQAAKQMEHAALELLDCLGPEHREQICLPFDQDERRTWFYTPTDHGGLAVHEVPWREQRNILRLLASGLSTGGYATAALIMGATHDILEQVNRWPPLGSRDSRYFVSIFGEPGSAQAWGWRFGGHHLSLNYTIAHGRVGYTPNFMGIDPTNIPLIGEYVFRPLGALEDLGRELVGSLDEPQRSTAIICEVAPADMVTGNRPAVLEGARPPHLWETSRGRPQGETLAALKIRDEKMMNGAGIREEHLAQLEWARSAKGIFVGDFDAAQRRVFDKLLEQYLGRMPDELADRERHRLADVYSDLRFAWAGGVQAGQPHYYRIQGPRLLVEYDNFHRDAHHIHAVWRNPDGDFGEDILKAHIAHDH